MSWYEHVGRTVCLIVCKNHQVWERILKKLQSSRQPDFVFEDLTRHTHYSAWHNFHNVICGAAGEMDKYLEIVRESKCKVMIIHGKQDGVVPLTCSLAIKCKIGQAKLNLVENANHTNIILGRAKTVAEELEEFWASCRCVSNGIPRWRIFLLFQWWKLCLKIVLEIKNCNDFSLIIYIAEGHDTFSVCSPIQSLFYEVR